MQTSPDIRDAVATRRVRFPLRMKLWLFAAVLLVAHLVAVGWAAIALTRGSIETSQRELQIAVIENVADRINEEFSAAHDGLELLGRTLTDDSLSEDARLSLASALVTSNEVLDNAVVFARDGSLITPIVEEHVADLPTPTVLPEALRTRAIANGVAADAASAFGDDARVLLVLPMVAQGEVTGFATSLVATKTVGDVVSAQADAHFTDGRSALFVVDDQRRYIAHPEQAALSDASEEPIFDGLQADPFDGSFSRAAEFVTADGTSMVGTIVGLPGRRWSVVAQVPHDVVYAPVAALRRVVAIAVGIAMVIALISSVVLASRLTSPLNDLSRFAEALARRDFETRVSVNTSDELALLGDVMCRAAADLQDSEKRVRREEAIRADLRRYLPGELVDKVVQREQSMSLGGERKEITVLFADVVAFTPLTRQLPPEVVVEILNELFTIVTEIVFRHGGTVDKFIGDCVMALWGAPNDNPEHAASALEAATEIVSWLEVGNARWQARYGITVEIAVGVNSGSAVVGNVGSSTRMEYTAIGQTVNVASRLEAIARPMQILVTDATREAAGDGFTFLEAGQRVLAGSSEPVALYEVVG